ncbi:unknown [Clostridium sp. CAG:1024]|nr:unknown [Clostridium sp. CAG:1024]
MISAESVPVTYSADVKYRFSVPGTLSFSPRSIPKCTEPPMPNSMPRLKMMFQTGEISASAAVPLGP